MAIALVTSCSTYEGSASAALAQRWARALYSRREVLTLSRALAQLGRLWISRSSSASSCAAASVRRMASRSHFWRTASTQSSASQSGNRMRPVTRLRSPSLEPSMRSIGSWYPARMTTVLLRCSGEVMSATSWSIASEEYKPWPRVYASSMKSTPPCASAIISFTLSLVCPTKLPCMSSPLTTLTWLLPSTPTSCRICAMARAMVVLPVPGEPRKTYDSRYSARSFPSRSHCSSVALSSCSF
mmetsp:Transcript_34029/g.109291  ORF Transcript_34029/g.109291 Transcript_34029/m.109291 type:complete len:242 (-) Transcript_34029:679-1404(-)